MREWMYSYTHSEPRHYMKVSGQYQNQAAKSRNPLARRLGGVESLSRRGGGEKKTPVPSGSRTNVVQPVV
jgi:hypothetical protein